MNDKSMRETMEALLGPDTRTPEEKEAHRERMRVASETYMHWRKRGLSTRLSNCLANTAIATDQELAQRTAAQLKAIPAFGNVCLKEVVAYLQAQGLSLPPETNTADVPHTQNMKSLPPADRIALARELLEGTGKCVADAVVIGKPSVWPTACLHPNSCARHRDCMYLGCEHQGFSIADGVDAALAALKAQENTP